MSRQVAGPGPAVPSQRQIDIYEADKDFTKDDRLYMVQRLSTVIYSSLLAGWAGFGVAFGTPLYLRFKKTGSMKTPNFGWVTLGGFISMGIVSQAVTSYTFNSQLERTKSEGRTNATKILELMHPGESAGWWAYYKVSSEDPSKRLTDPRLNGPKKTLLNQGDLFGLEPKKRQTEVDDPFNSDHDANSGNSGTDSYGSSWDKLRKENGIESNNSSWNRIRNGPQAQQPRDTAYSYQSPPKADEWSEPKLDNPSSADIDQASFDELLDRERNVGGNDDKW